MRYKQIITLLLLWANSTVFQVYARPLIKAGLGPGLNYGHDFLLPSAETEGTGLLSTSNDVLLWNPYVFMSLEGTCKITKPWYVSAEIIGSLMRNGRGIITDS